MTKRCGWCGRYLGEIDGQGVEGETHGICKLRKDKVLKNWREMKKKSGQTLLVV